MTPRQRAYKLAAERGVTLHPSMDGPYMEGVGIVGPSSAKMIDRGLAPMYFRGAWGGRPSYSSRVAEVEPTASLWRRVCAVLEEMSDDQG